MILQPTGQSSGFARRIQRVLRHWKTNIIEDKNLSYNYEGKRGVPAKMHSNRKEPYNRASLKEETRVIVAEGLDAYYAGEPENPENSDMAEVINGIEKWLQTPRVRRRRRRITRSVMIKAVRRMMAAEAPEDKLHWANAARRYAQRSPGADRTGSYFFRYSQDALVLSDPARYLEGATHVPKYHSLVPWSRNLARPVDPLEKKDPHAAFAVYMPEHKARRFNGSQN